MDEDKSRPKVKCPDCGKMGFPFNDRSDRCVDCVGDKSARHKELHNGAWWVLQAMLHGDRCAVDTEVARVANAKDALAQAKAMMAAFDADERDNG